MPLSEGSTTHVWPRTKTQYQLARRVRAQEAILHQSLVQRSADLDSSFGADSPGHLAGSGLRSFRGTRRLSYRAELPDQAVWPEESEFLFMRIRGCWNKPTRKVHSYVLAERLSIGPG